MENSTNTYLKNGIALISVLEFYDFARLKNLFSNAENEFLNRENQFSDYKL